MSLSLLKLFYVRGNGLLKIAIVGALSLRSAKSVATLGEALASDSSVRTEQTQMKALSVKTTRAALYSTHELTAGLNTIREYTNSDGVVFAVTWSGPSHPDLETLFGSYYSEYQAAEANRPKGMGHGAVALKTARLAIRRGGHMRALKGAAVISNLVPTGVKAEELP